MRFNSGFKGLNTFCQRLKQMWDY